MRHSFTGLLAVAAMGGLLALGPAGPAAAQVASPGSALGVQHDLGLTTTVQSRRGWRGRNYSNRRSFNRRAYTRRGYGRSYGYRRGGGSGAAIGAGIAGLAAGAIIGGALSSQAAPGVVYGGGGSAVDYCLSRFQSYDPASGTYLGYDGLRHPCP